MEEKVEYVKRYQEELRRIREMYMFETDQEAVNFILNYEDEFDKEFIRFCEGF